MQVEAFLESLHYSVASNRTVSITHLGSGIPFSHLYLSSKVTSCQTLHMALTPARKEVTNTGGSYTTLTPVHKNTYTCMYVRIHVYIHKYSPISNLSISSRWITMASFFYSFPKNRAQNCIFILPFMCTYVYTYMHNTHILYYCQTGLFSVKIIHSHQP